MVNVHSQSTERAARSVSSRSRKNGGERERGVFGLEMLELDQEHAGELGCAVVNARRCGECTPHLGLCARATPLGGEV